jgi:hypothetical protein
MLMGRRPFVGSRQPSLQQRGHEMDPRQQGGSGEIIVVNPPEKVTDAGQQREFQLARSNLDIDSSAENVPHLCSSRSYRRSSIKSASAQHVLEVFRRTPPDSDARKHLDRPSKRLTKFSPRYVN